MWMTGACGLGSLADDHAAVGSRLSGPPAPLPDSRQPRADSRDTIRFAAMKRQWQLATALVFAFALLLTFPGFLPGRILLPLDHPRDLGAWKPDPESRFEISNKIVSDPIYEYLAWDMEIRRLLAAVEMPWRN